MMALPDSVAGSCTPHPPSFLVSYTYGTMGLYCNQPGPENCFQKQRCFR